MISLVSTVLNDREGLIIFFEQMEAQTRQPDEIVIVDGGSKDGTWELLQDYAVSGAIALRCIQEISCNVARGRNLAIQKTAHDLIASTDIGCAWDAEWLEELIAPLEADPEVDYVIGSWSVPPETVHTAWAKTEYVLRNGHRFEAQPEANATSRSIAYHKRAWLAVGGYPEDLTLAADDTVFDLLLKKHQFKAAATGTVRCYWHRFQHLRQYLKEERRNFYGDGEALIRRKHFVLVGGRLCLEAVGLLGLMMAWIYPVHLWLGLVLFGLALLSVIQKITRFQYKAKQLAQLEVNFALGRLLLFDYLAKLNGLSSYIAGVWHGTQHCQQCRVRLHQPLMEAG